MKKDSFNNFSEGINVLSYFDGMSGGQIALKELGIPVKNYFAAEIDKFAIQQTQHNFPGTIQLGSVTDIDLSKLPKIDLFIGGSPCQGFSFAGKQLNFNDPRSKLFFEYAKALKYLQKHNNPNIYFMLENVNMKPLYLGIISRYLGIYPVNINSNLVSAQNRNRWYWSNIRTKQSGLFNELHTDIPQPKDKGILLKDILQQDDQVDEKYYLKAVNERFNGLDIEQKVKTLRASGRTTQTENHNFDLIKLSPKLKIKRNQNKASTLTGASGHSAGNHSDMDIILTKNYIQWDISGKGYKSQQDRAFYQNGKHGSLSTSRADTKNGVLIIPEATKKGYVEIAPNECVDLENQNSKTRLGRKMDKKTNCLMAKTPDFYKHTDNYILRRLTPIECARLQTVPEWYKWIVSDSQIYKMLGNGWTIEVIKHIFSFLPFNKSFGKIIKT